MVAGNLDLGMPGVLVHRWPSSFDPEDREESTFSSAFASVLSALANHSWLVFQTGFAVPQEEDDPRADGMAELLDRSYVKEEMCHVSERGFLPRYARYVTGGWNRLYGFREPVSDIDAVVGFSDDPAYECGAVNTHPELLHLVDVIFVDFDGAYWAFFSKSQQLVATVVCDLEVKGFTFETMDLKSFVAMHNEGSRQHLKTILRSLEGNDAATSGTSGDND